MSFTIPFIGLLNNTALLLALGVLYGTLQRRSDTWGWRIASGFLLGGIAVGVMLNPWTLAPGVFFDTRAILLSVGGLFLGAVPTAIAVAIAAFHRIYAGGAGAFTGSSWIVVSGLMGVAWAQWHRSPAYKFSALEFYLFGLVVQVVMLLLMFTMPAGLVMPILQKITLPILLIFPFGTVLLAKLLAAQELQLRNQRALDQSERKYRELVQNSRVILLSLDRDGNVTFINEYAQDFFGYPKAEILGRNVVGTIVPDTRAAGWNLDVMTKKIASRPELFFEIETPNVCRDGRSVRVLWKTTPMRDAAGAAVGFQCIGHDLTELRRAQMISQAKERQLQRLVEVSPVALAIGEQNRKLVYLNQKFTELFGYTLEDLSDMEDWWRRVCPDEEYRAAARRQWDAAVADALEGQTDFVPQTLRVACGDGKIREVVGRFSSIGEKEILVFTDVTRERELDRMKSEFIAIAAHELRTPLASIKGFTELLQGKKDFESSQCDEFLSIIIQKTEALEKIIDDLLDLGRLESGLTIHLEKISCDICFLVELSVATYRKRFPHRRIEYRWPEPRPEFIFADLEKINQVLENLLSNAVKFSAPTGVIRVEGLTADTEVRVTVCDEGIGMTPEQVARVFDKFYRVDGSDTAVSGMGLGMALAKGIIEAHGGSIQVQSAPGRGTSVCFILPLGE